MNRTSQVAVLRTRPETVVDDYGRLMRLVKYDQVLPRDQDLILKLNLSWTKYFPACSSQPWQVDGIVSTLLADGYDRARILPVENKTVVTNPVEGCRNNKWFPILKKAGLPFIPLPDVEWVTYRFKSPLLKLNHIFPEGIEIPKMYVGRNILHAPTVKCVHPDTEILLADGQLVRAEMLVKGSRLRELVHQTDDGDEFTEGVVNVVSLKPAGLSGAQATKFWRTPVTDPTVFKVRTRTGRQVITSARHPFLTPEGWKRADELRLGDRIAIARHVRIDATPQELPDATQVCDHDAGSDRRAPGRADGFSEMTRSEIVGRYMAGESLLALSRRFRCRTPRIAAALRSSGIGVRSRRVPAVIPSRTSPEFWRWIGYFVAEGYAVDHHGSFQISLGNANEDVRSDWVTLTRKLFGLTVRAKRLEMMCWSRTLRSLFETLGFTLPTQAATKAVPDLLFRCSDAEIAAFLQAYFDGDGTVGHDGVHATTKSQRLARQLQSLLVRLGVVAFLREEHRNTEHRRRSFDGQYFKVSIYGENAERLARWIRFRCAHKQARLDALVARRVQVKVSHWDTIPVPRGLFRMVRKGLGLSRTATGRPSLVGNIEDRCSEVTRPVIRHFIEVFADADRTGRFREEIAHMGFLASDHIAWDRVEEVCAEAPDVPFFYDLSVDQTHSFVGNDLILHNTHGHSRTTGAIKNSFGGLLKEVRHYAHEFMHEVLVDLMYMQCELHPGVLAVMDGTVMGDGAGPRTMIPRTGNLILASADQVAIDAIAARIMGFAPLEIPYLRMCHERGLGIADPKDIEIVGDVDAAATNMGFKTSRSLVIWGDQLIRKGPLKPLKRLLLHSPLMVWAPFASNVYHDLLWYPTVGRSRIREFNRTPWGQLFDRY